jgi:hypothetical protein
VAFEPPVSGRRERSVLCGFFLFHSTAPNHFHLDYAFVRPEMRRKHIFYRLMRALVLEMPGEAVTEVTALVTPTPSAIKAFRSWAFHHATRAKAALRAIEPPPTDEEREALWHWMESESVKDNCGALFDTPSAGSSSRQDILKSDYRADDGTFYMHWKRPSANYLPPAH